jgi:hypothetical protein
MQTYATSRFSMMHLQSGKASATATWLALRQRTSPRVRDHVELAHRKKDLADDLHRYRDVVGGGEPREPRGCKATQTT